jgi:endoglucanase
MEKLDLKSVLSELCAADGVSGSEENIAQLCAEYLKSYGEVSVDSFNNVTCTVDGFCADKLTLVINAHIDEIGMIVNYITDDGFLRVSACGGIDERVLPAAQVTVLGKERLYGVFTSVPPHLQSKQGKTAGLSELYVDIGMSGERAKSLVSLGDRVLIENPLQQMGKLVTSKAIDDRSCVAAIIYALSLIKDKSTAYNIKVLLSTKEEVGSQGAKTAMFNENADLALAVDVTFGRVHGESEENTGEIGSGAMIGVSPTLSRLFSNALIGLAKEENIPYQIEVMGGKTGTDADAFSVSKSGVAACTLSVPIRYMHTPVEAVSLDDIENTAKLIAAFCERGQCR